MADSARPMIPVMSFDAAAALALELENRRVRPWPARGEPVEAYTRLYEDDELFAGIWECSPGEVPADRGRSQSYTVILAGSGHIVDPDGTKHAIEPGAVNIEPEGWIGEWHITKTVRKFYVIRKLTD